MTPYRRQLLATYLRMHLLGAGAGIRLAELLVADPWTDHTLDNMPHDLADEVDFTRTWASSVSGVRELWVTPAFAVTAAARTLAAPLRPTRGRFRRVLALEAMRSLVLAKKAMWEFGLALGDDVVDPPTVERLRQLNDRAERQVSTLQELHQRASAEAFT
ncbi:hypothetical protein V1Y59_18000 [Gordonia sp. PKS22-38]|uniref:Uncharacterized protein n=1 Tax=Gordonia prachuapensis TaxID=3115651 RepID=A0ABU7MZ07_9ACTN|nr:hypothetical protein [Gordonia sp. PKS22-38]